MNTSSLYLDHSMFSGHTCRAIDGESNTKVKVSHHECIILSHCDTLSRSLLLKLQIGHYDKMAVGARTTNAIYSRCGKMVESLR